MRRRKAILQTAKNFIGFLHTSRDGIQKKQTFIEPEKKGEQTKYLWRERHKRTLNATTNYLFSFFVRPILLSLCLTREWERCKIYVFVSQSTCSPETIATFASRNIWMEIFFLFATRLHTLKLNCFFLLLLKKKQIFFLRMKRARKKKSKAILEKQTSPVTVKEAARQCPKTGL